MSSLIPLNNLKKILIVVLVVIIITPIYLWIHSRTTNIYEFGGNVDKIENGVVFVSGYLLSNGLPIPGKENDLIQLQINTDNNTTLTRIAIEIPKGLKSFDTKDLNQVKSVVGLDVIINDSLQPNTIGVSGWLRKGILNDNYLAKSLLFRVPIFGN